MTDFSLKDSPDTDHAAGIEAEAGEDAEINQTLEGLLKTLLRTTAEVLQEPFQEFPAPLRLYADVLTAEGKKKDAVKASLRELEEQYTALVVAVPECLQNPTALALEEVNDFDKRQIAKSTATQLIPFIAMNNGNVHAWATMLMKANLEYFVVSQFMRTFYIWSKHCSAEEVEEFIHSILNNDERSNELHPLAVHYEKIATFFTEKQKSAVLSTLLKELITKNATLPIFSAVPLSVLPEDCRSLYEDLLRQKIGDDPIYTMPVVEPVRGGVVYEGLCPRMSTQHDNAPAERRTILIGVRMPDDSILDIGSLKVAPEDDHDEIGYPSMLSLTTIKNDSIDGRGPVYPLLKGGVYTLPFGITNRAIERKNEDGRMRMIVSHTVVLKAFPLLEQWWNTKNPNI